jgi:hypothetical protein
MLAILLAAAVAGAPSPQPSATPLKVIVHVKSSPLCSTLGSNVFHTIEGLRVNDKMIDSSKPLLLDMGRGYVHSSDDGARFDQQQAQWGNTAGGIHDTDPGLEMASQQLSELVSAIVHNLQTIDTMLKDPTRFPSTAASASDEQALQLKAELQAVADRQKANLNVLSGLADTFALQDIIAKGDGTLGAINGGGAQQVSHNDQDVSFQDALSGPDRGNATAKKAIDPGLSQNPAVVAAASDLANNPFGRFYLAIAQNQALTQQSEAVLAQTVVKVANSCR